LKKARQKLLLNGPQALSRPEAQKQKFFASFFSKKKRLLSYPSPLAQFIPITLRDIQMTVARKG
jgi:hypothetical protein